MIIRLISRDPSLRFSRQRKVALSVYFTSGITSLLCLWGSDPHFIFQTGDYYRLVNPFENNNHVLWQFVSKNKKETVVCGVRLHSEANPHIYLYYPQGLDADMKYEDIATGKVYTGSALMKAGLPLPLTTGDYQPIKFTFRAVER